MRVGVRIPNLIKWTAAFVFIPVIGLPATYLLLSYAPITPHKPRCELSDYEFSSHLKPEYRNFIGDYVAERWDEKSHALRLGTSGYFFVYKDQIFLTWGSEYGGGLHHLMMKGAVYLLIPEATATGGFDAPVLKPSSPERIQLYWKWQNARSQSFGTSRDSDERREFDHVHCEMLHKVSQKRPMRDISK